MKCDVCSKQATVFLTQIINGQMTTVNLCEPCAKEKGVTDSMGFGLAEAFVGPSTPANGERTCANCGFTQSQLKKIGRMGCPECYQTFRDGLDSLLSAMHKGTEHTGKSPGGKGAVRVVPPTSATDLREQLQTAVAEERYEDAARLKAKIDALATKAEA
jgi:protein arginine kinase activator